IRSLKVIDQDIKAVREFMSATSRVAEDLQRLLEPKKEVSKEITGFARIFHFILKQVLGKRRYADWAKSAEMIRGMGNKTDAELRWGALREEFLIHWGKRILVKRGDERTMERRKLSRWSWFSRHEPEEAKLLTSVLAGLAALVSTWIPLFILMVII